MNPLQDNPEMLETEMGTIEISTAVGDVDREKRQACHKGANLYDVYSGMGRGGPQKQMK